ncbi:MAG: 7-carboxy-7-deazaguanine synthase [Acidobacteria bacterium]|nr:7-carboxy-7-deazaguanine synthase [Acidobacteriota bacterium]
MSYFIKEIYYSLQGEGAQTGRPAVFCRFAGCNLWSGREQDRRRAVCRFCDTDFVGADGPGGGVFGCAGDLAGATRAAWSAEDGGRPMVVCTGGEPLLQLDTALVQAFRGAGLEVALETNGTLLPPEGIDWVCVSPKAGSKLALARGDELKLIYPQKDAEPELYQELGFRYFFLQPMDGPALEENTRLALRYCLDHPRWRLSLQIHKFLGMR